MTKLNKGRILLNPLKEYDAAAFYNLYKDPGVNHNREPFLLNESPLDFTKRIIQACVEIYTIRLTEDQETIIGDCALHDPNHEQKEIEIGGSLLTAFQGKGYMQEAFGILETRVKEIHGMCHLLSKTEEENKNAIRLMEKLGYNKHAQEKGMIIYRKSL